MCRCLHVERLWSLAACTMYSNYLLIVVYTCTCTIYTVFTKHTDFITGLCLICSKSCREYKLLFLQVLFSFSGKGKYNSKFKKNILIIINQLTTSLQIYVKICQMFVIIFLVLFFRTPFLTIKLSLFQIDFYFPLIWSNWFKICTMCDIMILQWYDDLFRQEKSYFWG